MDPELMIVSSHFLSTMDAFKRLPPPYTRASAATALLKPAAHARRCRLETVPAQVEKLSSLRILDLTNNRIGNEGLPTSLARLPHLRAIGLKKNALTAVPRVLGYMRSLQEIYLEDNADLQARACSSFLHRSRRRPTLFTCSICVMDQSGDGA